VPLFTSHDPSNLHTRLVRLYGGPSGPLRRAGAEAPASIQSRSESLSTTYRGGALTATAGVATLVANDGPTYTRSPNRRST
jgi:hypothetical protein